MVSAITEKILRMSFNCQIASKLDIWVWTKAFSVIAEIKFGTLGPFVTTYISDILLFEPVLYHLSIFSVVSVFAETKFEIALTLGTFFIIDV